MTGRTRWGRRHRVQAWTTSSREGWAVSNVDRLGEGPGFGKIRTPLGVTAFGINAIVLPTGIETGRHLHERQPHR